MRSFRLVIPLAASFWLLASPVAHAQTEPSPRVDTLTEVTRVAPPVRYDSAAVRPRAFDEAKRQAYLRDEDYAYEREVVPAARSWWDDLKLWFWLKVLRFIFNENTATAWRWGTYLAVIGVAVYVVLKLTQTNLRTVFFGTPAALPAGFLAEDEDIHALDFEALLAEAIGKQNYRRAVQLLYLQALKQLSDRQWIDWKINKTNQDYARELRQSRPDGTLAGQFGQLTLLFEYVCYGDFPLTAEAFARVRGDFQALSAQVQPSAFGRRAG